VSLWKIIGGMNTNVICVELELDEDVYEYKSYIRMQYNSGTGAIIRKAVIG
jgi:hypothetical protein